MNGTSPEASVTDTSVWQFAFLPSAVAYCGAAPTEAFALLRQSGVADHQPGSITADSLSAWFQKVAFSGALSHRTAPMK
jgi:hypothetical protein